MSCRRCFPWMRRCRPSPDDLLTVEDALRRQLDIRAAERAFVTERCIRIDMIKNHILRSGSRPGQFLGAGSRSAQAVAMRFMPSAIFRYDLCALIDVMSDYVETLRLPYPQSLMKARSLGPFAGQLVPTYCIVTVSVTPSAGGRHSVREKTSVTVTA